MKNTKTATLIIASLMTLSSHQTRGDAPPTVDSDYTGAETPKTAPDTNKHKFRLGVSGYSSRFNQGSKSEPIVGRGVRLHGDMEYKVINTIKQTGSYSYANEPFAFRPGISFDAPIDTDQGTFDIEGKLRIGDLFYHLDVYKNSGTFSVSVLPTAISYEQRENLERNSQGVDVGLIDMSWRRYDFCGSAEIMHATLGGSVPAFDFEVSEVEPLKITLCGGRNLGENVGYLQGSVGASASLEMGPDFDVKKALIPNNVVANARLALINLGGVKGLNLTADYTERNRSTKDHASNNVTRRQEQIFASGIELSEEIFQ